MSLFLRRFPLLRRDPRHEDVMHHLSRGAVGDVSFCAAAATLIISNGVIAKSRFLSPPSSTDRGTFSL